MKFVMNGYKGQMIHGAHSPSPLEIKGCFHASGPQPVGDDGGVPQWVADVLERNPLIKSVAISGEGGGVVWSRITPNEPIEGCE